MFAILASLPVLSVAVGRQSQLLRLRNHGQTHSLKLIGARTACLAGIVIAVVGGIVGLLAGVHCESSVVWLSVGVSETTVVLMAVLESVELVD